MRRLLPGTALFLVLPAILWMVGCLGTVDRLFVDDEGEGGPAVVVTEGGTVVPASDASDEKAAADGTVVAPDALSIGGTVTGLLGGGLSLQNNGGDDLPVNSSGAFSFPKQLSPGATYAVTVRTQPTAPAQTCTVVDGTGTVGVTNVTSVAISCVTNTYKVGGSVVGLLGTGLVLQDNNGSDLTVNVNGNFTFATPLPANAAFSVTVKTQPSAPAQTCSVSGATGTVVSADVTSVVVNCGTNTFTIGGTVTGLAGTVVLSNNGGDDRVLTANGSFAFPTPISNGTPYAVTVKTQPTFPPSSQTCVVGNGSGTTPAANVSNVTVTCTTSKFTVGGTVSGLTGTGLVVRNNGGDDHAIAANGTFTFATSVASGGAYAVTVFTQPSGPAQKCPVTSGAGTVGSANVTSVMLTCVDAIAFQENFDGVTAPALPAGWTSTVLSGSGGIKPWLTVSTAADSAPNSAFSAGYQVVSDVVLDSPAFTVGSSSAQLTFSNAYDLETTYDGGVLEISIAGGAFGDIIGAGGSFVSGGYTQTISSLYQSPIAGRKAWSGYNGNTFITSTVNLPAAASGQSVRLRFRTATDKQITGTGWHIDTIVVSN